MRTILSWLILTAVLFSLAGASLAQDAPDCTFDVQAAVDLLLGAQRTAEQGDVQAALTALAETRAALGTIESACVPTAFALSQTFEYPDSPFSLRHPEGWQVVAEDAGDGFYFGPADIADLERAANSVALLEPGQLILWVMDWTFSNMGANELARQLFASSTNASNLLEQTLEAATPAGLRTFRFFGAAQQIGSFYIIEGQPAAAGEPTPILLMAVVSRPEGADQAMALLEAVVPTIELNPEWRSLRPTIGEPSIGVQTGVIEVTIIEGTPTVIISTSTPAPNNP